MLSMNGIIVCELVLGVVLMSLVFTSLANTDLSADSASKSKHEPESDTARTATKPCRAQTEISRQMYMRVLAGDYYWVKATGTS